MIDMKKLEKDILDYLNEFPVENRNDFQIVISQETEKIMTEDELKELSDFGKTEMRKSFFVSQYLDYDIVVVNQKIRPVKDILEINI